MSEPNHEAARNIAEAEIHLFEHPRDYSTSGLLPGEESSTVTLARAYLALLSGPVTIPLDSPPPTEPGWYPLEYKGWSAVVEVKEAYGALRFHPAPPWHSKSWHAVRSLDHTSARWGSRLEIAATPPGEKP